MNAQRAAWPTRQQPILLALIALLWLLMQQQLFTHVISHADGTSHASSAEKTLPGDSSCERCLTLSPLGASLGSEQPPMPERLATDETTTAAPAADPQLSLRRAFNSQAPPLI